MGIYDMNAAIDKPNILGSYQQGLQFGQQQRQQRMAEQDKQQVRNLAPQIIAGDPDAYKQAAAINPEAAGQYQQAGDSQVRRLKGFVEYVDGARKQAQKTGDMRLVNAALAEVAPYVSQLIGKPAPTEWTADMEPGWAAMKARIAMASQTDPKDTPTGFKQFQMTTQAAGLQPGTPEYEQAARIALGSEGRAATGGMGFNMVKNADGTESMGRTNPRTGTFEVYNAQTGQFEQLGGTAKAGAPAPGPQAPPGMTQVQYATGDGSAIPPNEQAAALAAFAANARGEDVDIPVGGALPPMQRPTTPGLGVSRTPEQQAALTTAAQEQAKINAEMGAYSQMTALEVDRAAQKAQAESNVKTQAEVSAKSGAKTRDAQATLSLLDEAERLLPFATNGRAENAMAQAAGQFGYATKGDKTTASLNLIAAELVAKVPRFEGPQSNFDVQFYREAAGDLANPNLPVTKRMAALKTMRRLRQQYLGGGQSPANQSPAGKTVKRTGMHNGRKVIQYSDGSTSYAD